MNGDKKKKKGKALPVDEAFKLLNYIFSAVLLTFNSRRHVFPPSEILPDAYAEVSFGKTMNGDYRVEVLLEDLKNLRTILSGEEEFMVWAEVPEVEPIPLGGLEIAGDKGALKTTFPEKPRVIFITVEDSSKKGRIPQQRVFDSGEILKD